jgi:hypothetical protein
MSKIYKTARGKPVDFDRIKLTNESAIAVGNMKVNARGDVLGSGKQVAIGRNQLMDQVYNIPNDVYSPNSPSEVALRRQLVESKNTQKLAELANNLTVPIDSKEDQPTPTPTVRGSLASSIANPTTKTQELIPNPKEQKKSNGPGRI